MTSVASLPQGLESNDAELAALVSAWLGGSRIPLPEGFRLVLEVTEEIPSIEDPRTAYSQSSVDIRAGAPLGWVHLQWRSLPAMARVEEDRPVAKVFLSRAAIADPELLFQTFLLLVLIFLWRRAGRFHLHAGTAVDPNGRGWLLAGPSESGKSTTIALLAARGWRVGTDDIAFLTGANGRAAVLGFHSPIALRPGGHQLLASHVGDGIALRRRNKTGFFAEDLRGGWLPSVEPDVVLFTELGSERTRLEPLPPAAIMRSLLQWSPWVLFEPTASQEHLDLLSRLGRQARCYRAQLAPDLFEAPRALLDFLP